MKFRIIFIIGCLFCLSACFTTNTDNAEAVHVEIESPKRTQDSELFTDREIIILETTPESLLAGISAIDIYKDRLYILDSRKTGILVFDRDGKYISTIGRQGRGPGEYYKIFTFFVDRDKDEIIITTEGPNKIMWFSLSGKYLAETRVDDMLYEIAKNRDKLYTRLLANEKYDLALYRIEGHSVESVEYLETPKLKTDRANIVTPPGNMLLMSKSGILFTRTFDDTIYKIENDELTPLVTIDFGKYYLDDANTLDHNTLLQKIFQDNLIYGISNAKNMGRGRVIFNGFPHGVFVRDRNGVRHYGTIENNLSRGKDDMTPVLSPDDDHVSFVYKASDFARLAGADNIDRTDKDVSELLDLKPEDNPVIFLYKLK